MTRSLRALLTLVALATVPVPARTQTLARAQMPQPPSPPRVAGAIPLFDGARSVRPDTSDRGAEGLAIALLGEELTVKTRAVAAFEVAAHPEAVLAFFAARLGGKEDFSFDEGNHTRLAPGEASPVLRIVNNHEVDARQRAVLGSRPARDGKFVKVAGFMWGVREPNADIASFTVAIRDDGVAADWSRYSPRTRIVNIRTVYANPGRVTASMADQVRKAMTDVAKEPPKAIVSAITVVPPAPPATPATNTDADMLGVPLYPGAILDPRASSRTTRRNARFYVYHTPDEPAKVVQFYRQRLTNPPQTVEEGLVFIMEGSLPYPRLAVYVNRNTVGGRIAKTVIVIRRGS